jgi:hypothetical protein
LIGNGKYLLHYIEDLCVLGFMTKLNA